MQWTPSLDICVIVNQKLAQPYIIFNSKPREVFYETFIMILIPIFI